jgi:hypothetical protein
MRAFPKFAKKGFAMHSVSKTKVDNNTNLKAALEYAKLGWPVFPLHERYGDGSQSDECGCGNSKCKNQGKHPIGIFAPNGFKDATTDPGIIKNWWSKRPKANIGIRTGKASDIFVLDLDRKKGKDGVKVLEELENKLGPLPVTATVLTPNHGEHRYYCYEGGIGSGADVLGAGVDTRGDRGYIIAPPSHDGRYKWVDEDATVEDVPEAWVKHIQGLFAAPDKKPKDKSRTYDKPSLEVIKAALDAINNDASVGRGKWVDLGQAVWQGTDGSEAGFDLFDAWSKQHSSYDQANTRETWDSFKPHLITVGTLFHMAKEADPSWRDRVAGHRVSHDGRIMLDKNDPFDSAIKYHEHMVASDRAYLRYHRGCLYGWTGTHYVEVAPKVARSAVYQFLHENAATIDKTQAIVPFKPRPKVVSEIVDCLDALVHQRDGLAERETPFWIEGSPNEGRDPNDIIACRNGLLDLKTRELLPHDPLFFNFHCLPFDYDPEAKAPRWNKFVWELWPEKNADDKRARLLLGEIFGLLLTGDVSFQKIFLFIGPPRSGRGTIARILESLLGPEQVVSPTLAKVGKQFSELDRQAFGNDHRRALGKECHLDQRHRRAVVGDLRRRQAGNRAEVQGRLERLHAAAVPAPEQRTPANPGRVGGVGEEVRYSDISQRLVQSRGPATDRQAEDRVAWNLELGLARVGPGPQAGLLFQDAEVVVRGDADVGRLGITREGVRARLGRGRSQGG